MARLTEEMVIARSKQSDLSSIKKLNCWGAELGDVSLLRRMPNVEVLAFSINKIRTLCDFAACRRLRELYIRKNEIRDLREIRHLRRLPDLTSLWLDENPCTHHPQYRMTVLRNLPNLEKLDNVSVQAEEVQEAMRRGAHIPDSDDEGYPQQESYAECRRSSCSSSPEREQPRDRHEQASDSSEGGAGDPPDRADVPQCPLSPTRRAMSGSMVAVGAGIAPNGGGGHPADDERYEHPAMTRSHYDEYSYSNGECRYSGGSSGGGRDRDTCSERGVQSPQNYHEQYYERSDRSEPYQQVPRCEWEGVGGGGGAGGGREPREFSSAVMADHRGFTRRPVARNSNLLSAVLCLVKELDYPSLEVAEMAVRCRMDELANSQ